MNFKKSKNTEMLKEIQKKSVEQSNGLVAINIPLDEIDENPDNSEIFNMDKIKELADGIIEDGFIGAISVFRKPDGRYEISSGHRRYRAMQMLKRDTIPCLVSEMPSDTERALKLLSSNIRNRDMRPMDWAKAVEYFMRIRRQQRDSGEIEIKGKLRDEAARYFNFSTGQVSRYESLNKLIPELQEMANDPLYPWTAFVNAAGLAEAQQKELYRNLQSDIELATDRNRNDDLSRDDIRQNTITGQRIGFAIKKIKGQDEPAPARARVEKEAEEPAFGESTFDSYGGSAVEELSKEAVPGTFSPNVDKIIENDVYGNFPTAGEDGFEEEDEEDAIEGKGVEEPRPLSDDSVDDEIALSADRMGRLASEGAVIRDKKKVREYIAKLKEAIKILESLL